MAWYISVWEREIWFISHSSLALTFKTNQFDYAKRCLLSATSESQSVCVYCGLHVNVKILSFNIKGRGTPQTPPARAGNDTQVQKNKVGEQGCVIS